MFINDDDLRLDALRQLSTKTSGLTMSTKGRRTHSPILPPLQRELQDTTAAMSKTQQTLLYFDSKRHSDLRVLGLGRGS
jgi:hypothetical protein